MSETNSFFFTNMPIRVSEVNKLLMHLKEFLHKCLKNLGFIEAAMWVDYAYVDLISNMWVIIKKGKHYSASATW